MKTLVFAVTIPVALIASFALAVSWITLVEATGAVAVTLLIVLAVGRLREKSVKVTSEDQGQRHHRGRGGGGLM